MNKIKIQLWPDTGLLSSVLFIDSGVRGQVVSFVKDPELNEG